MRPTAAVGAALALALAAPRAWAQDAVRRLVVAQFERSYLTTTSLDFSEPHLIFEANLAPHFYLISTTGRFAVVLTPKVILRQFDVTSYPIRSPSYQPRATVYFWPRPAPGQEPGRGLRYYSVSIGHHSNGQQDSTRLPDGRLNENGSFGTNSVELAGTFLLPGARTLPFTRLAIEWHPPGWSDRRTLSDYSHLRLRMSQGFNGRFGEERDGRRHEWSVAATLGYLAGDLGPSFRGIRHFTWELSALVAPRWMGDFGFFADGYLGQDYYNIQYQHYRHFVRIGVATHTRIGPAPAPPP